MTKKILFSGLILATFGLVAVLVLGTSSAIAAGLPQPCAPRGASNPTANIGVTGYAERVDNPINGKGPVFHTFVGNPLTFSGLDSFMCGDKGAQIPVSRYAWRFWGDNPTAGPVLLPCDPWRPADVYPSGSPTCAYIPVGPGNGQAFDSNAEPVREWSTPGLYPVVLTVWDLRTTKGPFNFGGFRNPPTKMIWVAVHPRPEDPGHVDPGTVGDSKPIHIPAITVAGGSQDSSTSPVTPDYAAPTPKAPIATSDSLSD